MSEARRNIKSKLEGFEPEVNETELSEGWEKLRYFLPEEKKRRFVFFLSKRGAATFVMVISLCAMLLYRSFNNPPETVPGTTVKSQKAENPPTSSVQKRPAAKKDSTPPVTKGAEPFNITSATAMAIKIKRNEGARGQVPAYSPDGAVSTITQEVIIENNTGEEKVTGQDLEIVSANTLEPVNMYLPQDIKIDSVPIVFTHTPLKQPFKKSLYIELYSGGGNTASGISYLTNAIHSNHLNASAGVGLLWRLSENMNFRSDITINSSRMNYEEVETLGNKVVAKNNTVTIGSSMVSDTAYQYVKVRSKNTIQGSAACNFQVGAGYQLFHVQKFTMEATLQLALKYTGYNYNGNNEEGTDTLVYIRGTGAPALPGQVSTVNGENNSEHRSFTFGIVPGVVFSYHITPRLALLIRPTYFKQLSPLKIAPEQKQFGIRQDNLFLNAGIRIKI